MNKLSEYVGNTYIHPVLGEIKVLKILENSRTKLEVQVIDRGPGYNISKKKYLGIKLKNTWARGENYSYSVLDEVHYKDLEKHKTEQL